MRKVKQYLICLFSIGIYGDYNYIRNLALRFSVFKVLNKIHERSHCAYLPLSAKFDSYINFPHGVNGCFFSSTCKIGTDCTIMQHVTIGSNHVGSDNNSNKKLGAPSIGNKVFIGAGAKIIGPVTIGDNVKIGAGCIVVTDIPANSICVMNKPRIIVREVSFSN